MDDDAILASDAERDAVLAQLQQAHVEGRLTAEELQERIGRAVGARTRGELRATTESLPAVRHAAEPPARRRDPGTGQAWRAWAGVNIMCFIIWGVTSIGAGQAIYPWFLWVAGPWAGALLLGMLSGGGHGRG
jgi:hypothetical protein